MAGPYDILLIAVAIFGIVLVAPLAIAWSKNQTSQYISSAQTHQLEREREMSERETNRQIREALNRRAIAEAEAQAVIAEGRTTVIKTKVSQSVSEGNFDGAGLLALADAGKQTYDPPTAPGFGQVQVFRHAS